jgi:hypothetical protein
VTPIVRAVCLLIPLVMVDAGPGPSGGARSSRDSRLPSAVRAQLNTAFPGWRFAALAKELEGTLTAEAGRRRSPEWVSGDYNGDRKPDYAVQIIRRGPMDSAQIVVAFLTTSRGYHGYIVHASGEHPGLWLRTSRRGERLHDLDRDLNGDSTLVLTNDAIDIQADEGGLTCAFEAGLWRCFTSAD